jgi:acyl transferase domain-containing protein/thioesterase domain-containing protein/acyl carrier protein
MGDNVTQTECDENDIAIVGMAVNLPGANSLSQYWANLRDGVESIRKLTREELLEAGEDLGKLHHKNYVPSAAILEDYKMFDAEFFGLSPKDAAIMDPQHRKFLESSWEALENAGHPPEKFDGRIGVYAGCGMGSYFYFNLCSNPDLVDNTGMFLLRHTGNDKDFMATRLSHILDLKGPSINLQTACSTSLVATHYACQSLLTGECDMALAGGSTIELPHGRGYIFEDGEILSPDGHCHAFDHRAQGTVFGSGAGVVVLRRLNDAITDGDHIWGVIKGTAVNNDGAAKAGYLAPSVDGQATAILEAQAIAGVTADSIDYVECHGTGTYLGDPIEVAALTEAFSQTTDNTGFCRIGSVKSNIGHLDTAAGAASLVKTALSLHNRQIPASLGYEKPNPAIDFENSPFKVNAELCDWASTVGPRRAGVNSLGVGGTNAHVVLEEAPVQAASETSDWPYQILTISGKSRSALDANATTLAEHLRANTDQPLADIAYTLKEGRHTFEHRRVLVAETHEEAASLLENNDARQVFNHKSVGDNAETIFMFPGGGAQFVGMGRDLYETEPVFQEWVDRGLDILQPRLDYDIRALWLPELESETQAAETLKQPSVQLPLIMIIEYALAQLWMSWNVQPVALVGHSMGENTAACLAGVLSFEDCIKLVHLRGQLFDTVPAGGMLSIPLPMEEIQDIIGNDLDLASVNAPELSVVSGPDAALVQLQQQLAERDIESQRIAIDIAAHSRMLEPILSKFGEFLHSITLNPPQIPIVSNRTGDFLTATEATDPDYWVSHLRGTIHFADCISTLSEKTNRVYLEVGPGKALSSLAAMNPAIDAQQVLSSLRHPNQEIADDKYFLGVLGRLSATGIEIDWQQIWGDAKRNRVVLPTYAFQRNSYFIEAGEASTPTVSNYLTRQEDPSKWGYRPVWRPSLADCAIDVENELSLADKQTWLVLLDDIGVGSQVATQLRNVGHTVIEVRTGDAFARDGDIGYILAPERGREGFDLLIKDLIGRGIAPNRIVNLWLLTQGENYRPGGSFFHQNQEQGFYSLVFLAQAIAEENLPTPLHITTLTSGAAQVRKEPLAYPEKSTILGPIRIIPREFPGITCAALDVDIDHYIPQTNQTGGFWGRKRDDSNEAGLKAVSLKVLEDLVAPACNSIAAMRGEKRFELAFDTVELSEQEIPEKPIYQEGGTYLITGGFGGIGLTLAEDMIRTHHANVVLVARTPLPKRSEWEKYLTSHSPNETTSKRIESVQKLEALGGKVMVAAADVCNQVDMSTIVDNAQSKFGTINGVIHAAGIVDDAPLLTKNSASIEDVIAPKIHGTQVLHNLFADGALDWLVLFSSTSTVIAPAGQVDYLAANEYLNAYAKSRKGDCTKVIAINWGIWNEVGMAAQAIADRMGQEEPIPCYKIDTPLLDEATFDTAGNRVFTAAYKTRERWFLDEHRTKAGNALLPGTGYLELAMQALRANGENASVEINDMLFLRPLQVGDTETRTIQVVLNRTSAGYGLEVRSNCMLDGRKGFQLNAQANLAMIRKTELAPIDLQQIFARCTDIESIEKNTDTLRSPQENHLSFGSRWRVLKRMAYGVCEGIAELHLPAQHNGDIQDGYLLHPALLDLATGWAMKLVNNYEPTHLWVPLSYNKVRVYKSLPDQIFSWARKSAGVSDDSQTASFDITICDLHGNICLEINGFTIKRLEDARLVANIPALTASEVIFVQDQSGTQSSLSNAEQRLQHNLTQGILPAEGVASFKKAIASNLSQIFVSSLDLTELVQQANAASAETEISGQKFERPELDSEYTEPSNDIERTLVGFWEELLGVDQVGITDSFFDLGGHSLIAVRLFSMVKKAYQIEFPISILFEAPTIEKCAALIAKDVGGYDSDGDTSEPNRPAKTEKRFKHLVAMHDGEGGPKTPFFLVAGMFGNVLNLRHLAHLLGSDRPFYGLQARGLYGDEAPHTSLYETAADYIAEMRIVQPHGPYLLGGFSGGGITAYEISHQLEAEGETVSLLAMLDTPLPQRRPLLKTDRAIIHWQDIKSKGIMHLLQWPIRRIKWELSKRQANQDILETATHHQFNNTGIETAFLQSVEAYKVKPWTGPVILFRPPLVGHWKVSQDQWIDSQRAYVFHDNDWSQWTPHMRVFEVPGDHDSMVLEPNVRVLATRMKACIEGAETDFITTDEGHLHDILAKAAE